MERNWLKQGEKLWFGIGLVLLGLQLVSSPNLSVVEGTTPTDVNFVEGALEYEKFVWAKPEFEESASYQTEEEDHSSGAGCIISGVELADEKAEKKMNNAMDSFQSNTLKSILMSEHEGEKAGAEKI